LNSNYFKIITVRYVLDILEIKVIVKEIIYFENKLYRILYFKFKAEYKVSIILEGIESSFVCSYSE